MLDDAYTMAMAMGASLDNTISRTGALALLAYLLLVPLELGLATIIEISKRKSDLDLDIVTTGLPSLIMTAATEKATEEIEGVMVVAAASLLALFQPLMSVLVVDLA
jgi:hypothetical protein